MEHTITIQPWIESAIQEQRNGRSIKEVLVSFREKGLEESLLSEVEMTLQARKKLQLRNAGYVWVAIAFALLSCGFVLTLVLFQVGMNFYVAMYGLTLVGVGCAFKGIVNIMGW
jgi:hypothetical protein